MNCPRCDSSNFVKDGIVGKRQRYRCKECNYRYTVTERSSRIPDSTKRLAIEMYLEGLGFRSIGRLLGVSNVSVMNWIAAHSGKLASLRSPGKPAIVGIDELQNYLKQKENADGFGLLLIDFSADSPCSLLATGAKKPTENHGDQAVSHTGKDRKPT